jgi:hypothetical protein
MNINCKLGFHTWDRCKCTKCGETRDEQHDWTNDCEKCLKCGKTRENNHHWNGCKCIKCGKTRDEQHDWNGCKCSKCGNTRDEHHYWNGCKCSNCGNTRDEQHSWHDFKCTKCGIEKVYDGIPISQLTQSDLINELQKMGVSFEQADEQVQAGLVMASLLDSNQIKLIHFSDKPITVTNVAIKWAVHCVYHGAKLKRF